MGYLIIWLLCAGICYAIANGRNPEKGAGAAVLGFILGPIGVLIVFLGNNG